MIKPPASKDGFYPHPPFRQFHPKRRGVGVLPYVSCRTRTDLPTERVLREHSTHYVAKLQIRAGKRRIRAFAFEPNTVGFQSKRRGVASERVSQTRLRFRTRVSSSPPRVETRVGVGATRRRGVETVASWREGTRDETAVSHRHPGKIRLQSKSGGRFAASIGFSTLSVLDESRRSHQTPSEISTRVNSRTTVPVGIAYRSTLMPIDNF